jgi:glucose-6-phosphate isomerase
MQIDFTTVPKHLATRSHQDMQPVLMRPEAEGPSVHYYMIRGGKDQRNVTVWEPGTVGGEYVKTFGHYHVGDLDETYWIVEGEGVLLMQTLADQDDPAAVELFRAMRVKAGDEVYIPSGHGHLVANVGSTYLVTIDNSPVDFSDRDPASLPGHADYSKVRQMKGFAYYVVEHATGPALVRNPAYKTIRHEDLGGLQVIAQ